MDTLGLWLNFTTISVLIKSLFPETIFFSFASSSLPSLFLYFSLFQPFPFFFLTDYYYAIQAAFELTTLLRWLFQAECGDEPVILSRGQRQQAVTKVAANPSPVLGLHHRHWAWIRLLLLLHHHLLIGSALSPFESNFITAATSKYGTDRNIRVWKLRKVNTPRLIGKPVYVGDLESSKRKIQERSCYRKEGKSWGKLEENVLEWGSVQLWAGADRTGAEFP